MTLMEMSALYDDSALLISGRLAELRSALRVCGSEDESRRLRRRTQQKIPRSGKHNGICPKHRIPQRMQHKRRAKLENSCNRIERQGKKGEQDRAVAVIRDQMRRERVAFQQLFDRLHAFSPFLCSIRPQTGILCGN